MSFESDNIGHGHVVESNAQVFPQLVLQFIGELIRSAQDVGIEEAVVVQPQQHHGTVVDVTQSAWCVQPVGDLLSQFVVHNEKLKKAGQSRLL